MQIHMLNGRRIYMTTSAAVINEEDLSAAIHRHKQGDWGMVSKVLADNNLLAQSHGQSTISGHTDRNGNFFAIRYYPRNGLLRICMSSEFP